MKRIVKVIVKNIFFGKKSNVSYDYVNRKKIY
jgi:hypothetical protein